MNLKHIFDRLRVILRPMCTYRIRIHVFTSTSGTYVNNNNNNRINNLKLLNNRTVIFPNDT